MIGINDSLTENSRASRPERVPFVDMYRTFLVAPDHAARRMLLSVAQLQHSLGSNDLGTV